MRRFPLAPFAACVLVALAGCPGNDGATPPPGPAPVAPIAPIESRTPGGSPLPRGYEDVRAGQTYVYSLLAGNERKDKVKALAPRELLLERTVSLRGTSNVIEVKEPIPPPEEPRGEGTTLVEAGETDLAISGRRVHCKLRELRLDKEVLVREWVWDRYPFVVKRVGNGFTVLELTAIEEPGAGEK